MGIKNHHPLILIKGIENVTCEIHLHRKKKPERKQVELFVKLNTKIVMFGLNSKLFEKAIYKFEKKLICS